MTGLILLVIFFSLPAILVVIRNIFHDTYIWQIKEYRVDRIVSYLKYHEAKSYRSVLINFVQLILFSFSLAFFFVPSNYLLIIPVLTFATYIFEGLDRLQDILSSKLVRPKKSIRNLLITLLAFITLVLPLFIPIKTIYEIYQRPEIEKVEEKLDYQIVGFDDILIQTDDDYDIQRIPLAIAILMLTNILVLGMDLASPFPVAFWAVMTEPLAQYKRKKTIKSAKAKVTAHKGFKVIAITGSYGKSSTKEIVYELIKDSFKTAKTDENFNSTVGVAESIIRNLKAETEVFIAEMGAYKKGEIAQSTNLLVPDISIVTGITPQHLSLFGSMSNLVKAKNEIVENLKQEGLAIFNANNQHCLQMATKTTKRKLMYYTIDEETEIAHSFEPESKTEFPDPAKGMLYAKNITPKDDGFSFVIRYKDVEYPTEVKTSIRHNISNALAAVGVAIELGMDTKEIANKLKTINFEKLHLTWKIGINKSDVLDDSYNTNPEGFKSALKLLSKTKGKRLVITKGIIELGSFKKTAYKELAQNIIKDSDVLISTDIELIEEIKNTSADFETYHITQELDIVKLLNNIVKEGDNILIEGRFSPQLIKLIITN